LFGSMVPSAGLIAKSTVHLKPAAQPESATLASPLRIDIPHHRHEDDVFALANPISAFIDDPIARDHSAVRAKQKDHYRRTQFHNSHFIKSFLRGRSLLKSAPEMM
jgi:hypothetical protein